VLLQGLDLLRDILLRAPPVNTTELLERWNEGRIGVGHTIPSRELAPSTCGLLTKVVVLGECVSGAVIREDRVAESGRDSSESSLSNASEK